MDVGVFDVGNDKACKDCHEADERVVYMEATQAHHAGLAAYVDVWECPQCGRQIARDDGDGVRLTNADGERF